MRNERQTVGEIILAVICFIFLAIYVMIAFFNFKLDVFGLSSGNSSLLVGALTLVLVLIYAINKQSKRQHYMKVLNIIIALFAVADIATLIYNLANNIN